MTATVLRARTTACAGTIVLFVWGVVAGAPAWSMGLAPLLLQGAGAGPARSPATAAPEREAVLGVLKRYVTAMQTKDMPALRAIWPTMDKSQEAKIQKGFHFTRSLKITLDITAVVINGGTATVSGRRKDQVVTNEGQSFKSDRQATFKLEKSAEWTITDVVIE
jgi:hypothetical protein